MKYVTDGKSNGQNTKSDNDIAARTLYTMACRRDRRNYFSYSLIFLCVIFFLSLIAGCLLHIYLKRTNALPSLSQKIVGIVHDATAKTMLKNYFLSFLPFALIFVSGFTSLSSLISGLICAILGAYSGFSVMHMHGMFISEYLTSCIPLGLYCFILLYFSAVSVSFSHSMNKAREFNGMFEEDLACYLRYLLTSSVLILAVCVIYNII